MTRVRTSALLAAHEVVAEHGVLTRQLAGLQHRVGEQLRAHAAQVAALEGEVLGLRLQLVLARTCVLWGLNAMAATRPLPRPVPRVPMPDALAEASAVICQTGCVGHAHPWLEADGLCSRTGQACGLQSAEAPALARGLSRA